MKGALGAHPGFPVNLRVGEPILHTGATMADPRHHSEEKRREAARLKHAGGMSYSEIARRLGMSHLTIKRAAAEFPSGTAAPTLPDPAPEAGGPDLPEPFVEDLSPYEIEDPSGRWLVMSDCHIPYHDPRAVRLAVADGEARTVRGILLNGDVLDAYQISRFYKEPNKPRFVDEIKKTKQFLEWLRSRFPRARIIYKEGNHDARVRHYVAERTPELWGMEGYDLAGMLGLSDYGVEPVADKRPVHLGRLPIFHGHELGGSGGGVNPARWLFLKIVSTGMVSHFHRSSHHDEPAYDKRLHATWSIGCLAHLQPAYARVNKWSHGWAIVDTPANGSTFHVDNRRILMDGRVV